MGSFALYAAAQSIGSLRQFTKTPRLAEHLNTKPDEAHMKKENLLLNKQHMLWGAGLLSLALFGWITNTGWAAAGGGMLFLLWIVVTLFCREGRKP